MNQLIIDLRSDTVTTPCEKMKKVMLEAEVGDDVYNEDPSIHALQNYAAAVLGKESALFFPSGTQSNLVAMLSHCQRGDEYIAAQNAHAYKYEGGGAAVLGGIQPQPIERNKNGILDLDRVASAIKANDIHFAKTRLLALENTTSEGCAIDPDYFIDARNLCDRHGLALHLDGARIFNAEIATNRSAAELVDCFDSISICLSKGLGAPVGSVLVGSENFIETARRWRKVVGGGMRQAGLLAAAGLYALQNNIARLQHDHDLAHHLYERLSQIKGIDMFGEQANTNMVFFNLSNQNYDSFYQFGKDNGVLFGGREPIRMVTHRDINQDMVDIAVDRLSGFF